MSNSVVIQKPEKITIFGLAGTGKSSSAQILAEKLSYKYISSGNMYRQMASDHNMTLNQFETLTKDDDTYDRELDQRMREYGQKNQKYILESRLGFYFIPDSFKVALVCDFDTRVNRIAKRENKDIVVAENETKHREEIVTTKYKELYGLDDISNKNNFDLVIDTKENNIDQVVEIILKEYTAWLHN